ncbi:MAG: hypothetical protein RL441_1316 [Actinomycetota bacterium]
MKTVLLLRHARSTANAAGVLAGRMPGVQLDEVGISQAKQLADCLRDLSIEFIVHSDLERTKQTVSPLASASGITLREDQRLTECDYGDWSGKELKELSSEPLWKSIQSTPSSVTFPGGEAMIDMQSRAVAALDFWMEEATSLFAICSHGDVLKSLVAHAIGLPLDKFQGLHVSPASITVLQWDGSRWTLQALNAPASKEAISSLTLPSQNVVGGGDVSA